jgi:hypothetical protein
MHTLSQKGILQSDARDRSYDRPVLWRTRLTVEGDPKRWAFAEWMDSGRRAKSDQTPHKEKTEGGFIQ